MSDELSSKPSKKRSSANKPITTHTNSAEYVAPADGAAPTTLSATIQGLKKLNTHFVFFFGIPLSGKTVILASLLRSIREGKSEGKFTVNGKEPFTEGARLCAILDAAISNGHFPSRTKINRVFRINGTFIPENKRLPELNITFLDISGEDLSGVVVTEESNAKLPAHVDVYLKTSLPLVFILVTPWQEAEKQDRLFAQFLDYVNTHAPDAAKNRFILLVSQWDTPGNQYKDAYDFVEQHMPQTFSQIKSSKNIINEYSIGKVIEIDSEAPYIDEFDSDYPSRLWNQIYKTFTNKELIKQKSFLSRFFGW